MRRRPKRYFLKCTRTTMETVLENKCLWTTIERVSRGTCVTCPPLHPPYHCPPTSRLRLLPKCLQDVSNMDLSVNILGWPTSMPVGVAPTAYHKLAHSDGEVATARAAEKAGVIFTLSSLSSCSIEDIAEAAPVGVKWLQLYIFNDRSVT